MPIETIPVLEKDFELFDWNEHPHSYMALVKDAPVANFAKEAWNDIVLKLNDALLAAGMIWDNEYTTVRGAMVGEAYGEFSAEMFNSVRHNIDRIAPTGWRWANDPTFRGYVGRENFRGYRYYGKNCDFVYPEYIKELVRKLNLVIDIMKDNGNIIDWGGQYISKMSLTNDLGALLPKLSAPMEHTAISGCKTHAMHILSRSAPMEFEEGMKTLFLADADAPRVSVLDIHRGWDTNTLHTATVRSPKALYMSKQLKSGTMYKSRMETLRVIAANILPESAKTKSIADVDVWKSFHISGSGTSESNTAVELARLQPSPIVFGGLVKSLHKSESVAVEAKPMPGAAHPSETVHKGEILPRDAFRLAVADKSTTKHSANIGGVVPFKGGAVGTTESIHSAQIDSAWFPPEWVGDCLLIKQTHEATPNGNELGVM